MVDMVYIFLPMLVANKVSVSSMSPDFPSFLSETLSHAWHTKVLSIRCG